MGEQLNSRGQLLNQAYPFIDTPHRQDRVAFVFILIRTIFFWNLRKKIIQKCLETQF